MVRAFTAESVEEAERYVCVLRRYGIEALVRVTANQSVVVRTPEVWVARSEDLDRARAMADLRLGPWLDMVDGAPRRTRRQPWQFQWVDLFALTCFLPAAVGITLRQATQPLGTDLIIGVAYVGAIALALWAAVVFELQREQIQNQWLRLLCHALAFGALVPFWYAGIVIYFS